MKIHQPLSTDWTCRQIDPNGRIHPRFPATVPGCVHTDLMRAGKIADPFWGMNERTLAWIEEKGWSYLCEFSPEESLFGQERIELVAEGLDTFATLTLNGIELGQTENMFHAVRFDVTGRLKSGKNVLEVTFRSPMEVIRERMRPNHYVEPCDPVGGASLVRKEQCSFGWDWGPRLVTSGIWLPVSLEGWSEGHIESVRVVQSHRENAVDLTFHPFVVGSANKFRGIICLEGEEIAKIEDLSATMRNPQLWWPNGHGAQPLYEVRLELLGSDGNVLDAWRRKIGLRTIVLDRSKDQFGESFQFVVNHRPIFAKGANWIPAHSFVTETNRALYDDLLTSAVEANMNMVRVWGGGIYEKESFYDLCDEKGLLVWQDFMFACALYSNDKAFRRSIAAEAEFQVRRLAHRACLAVWCGNNELEQLSHEIIKSTKRKQAYHDIFYELLPVTVAAWDGVTPYWPSSPHNPEGWEKGHNNERAGDCHFWDVWHARKPVKSYEKKNFRFCSEFGMQSYSSPEIAATYCRPENWNVFGPEMENHQKNGAGNQIILDYVSRLFRFPKNFEALSYLSQLNQAYCMKVGIEHFRRSMPRTMGALYWQLNDCWPVASWSSLEFGGRWKALHYEVKRCFAPALLSAHVPGDEVYHVASNTLQSTIREVHLHTVFDGLTETTGTILWTIYHLEKGRLRGGKKRVVLRYGEAIKQIVIDLATDIKRYTTASLVLRAELSISGKTVSRQTVYLTAPRYLNLKNTLIDVQVEQKAPGFYELSLASPVFQAWVAFALPNVSYRAEDNFIDLYPGEPRRIQVRTLERMTALQLRRRLQLQSLAYTY